MAASIAHQHEPAAAGEFAGEATLTTLAGGVAAHILLLDQDSGHLPAGVVASAQSLGLCAEDLAILIARGADVLSELESAPA